MTLPPTGNPHSADSSHYFSTSPTSSTHKHEFSLTVGTTTLTLLTDRGVFSSHGLDKGTAVLLEWVKNSPLPPADSGTNMCDLGCGSGPIALTMAAMYPHSTVYALDINERARQLCFENAQRNKLTNVVVAHPNDVPANISFSLLWSNPPIRIGKNELHQLLMQWLSRLSSTGVAHLVVGKNLGADSLTTWLTGQGFRTTKRASSKGFRVLEVLPQQS